MPDIVANCGPQIGHLARPWSLCTMKVWRYRWTPLTVSLDQLRKERDHGQKTAPLPPTIAAPAAKLKSLSRP